MKKEIQPQRRSFFQLWVGLVIYPMYVIAINSYEKSGLESKRLSPLKRGLAVFFAFFYFMFTIFILPISDVGFFPTIIALALFTDMVQLSYMMIKGKYLIIDSQKKKNFYSKLSIGFAVYYWGIAIPLHKLCQSINLF